MKIPILGTGISGLVGSRLVDLLGYKYEFVDLSLDTGVDITDKKSIFKIFSSSKSEWVWHLAAKTDVDGCEQDKVLGKDGQAWQINVVGTQNVVSAAAKCGKKTLYVSTDFVFDGEADSYSETDSPHPINWYSKTKHEGEKITLAQEGNLVVRIAYPYRAHNTDKRDFVHAILAKLDVHQQVMALSDHVFTPTFIDDIALAIDLMITKKAKGIYHVVGSTSLTPFQAAKQIADVFGYSQRFIQPTNMASYYQNRAPRPYNLKLKNDRIISLGLRPKTFIEGLSLIKNQGVNI